MKTIELYQEDERKDGRAWLYNGWNYGAHTALNDKPDTITVNDDDVSIVHSRAAVEKQQFTGDTTEVENKEEYKAYDKEKIAEYEALGYVATGYYTLAKGHLWWLDVIRLPQKSVIETVTATRHETRTVTARYVEGKNRDGVVLFSGYEIVEDGDE